MTPGCATRSTPTRWPAGSPPGSPKRPACRPSSRVDANGVFVRLPAAIEQGLRERGWLFYSFIGAGGVRFMCGWDTLPETIDRLVADVRSLAQTP